MVYDGNWLNNEMHAALEKHGSTLMSEGGAHSIRATEKRLSCRLPVRGTNLEIELGFEVDLGLEYRSGAGSVECVLDEKFVRDFVEVATAIDRQTWWDTLTGPLHSLRKKGYVVGKMEVFPRGSTYQRLVMRLRSSATTGQYELTLDIPIIILKAAAASWASSISQIFAKKGWVSNPFSFSECGQVGQAALNGSSGAFLALSCRCSAGTSNALVERDRAIVSTNAVSPFPELKVVLYYVSSALLVEGIRSQGSVKERLIGHGYRVLQYKALSDHAIELVLTKKCQATESTHTFEVKVRLNEAGRVALSNDMRRLDARAKGQMIGSRAKKTLERVDAMSGDEFEHFCAELLRKLGYTGVRVTKRSNDGGSDVLATNKDLVRYAIQCKRHRNPVGRSAVKDAAAGKIYYGCHVGIVLSSGSFTGPTEDYAEVVGVVLWNRSKLVELITAAAVVDSPSRMADEDTEPS